MGAVEEGFVGRACEGCVQVQGHCEVALPGAWCLGA
jgi:hypothetical protein